MLCLDPPPPTPPFLKHAQDFLHSLVLCYCRLGFASSIGCVIGGIVCGRLGDVLPRFKPVLVLMFALATAIFVWFTLLTNKIIPASTWQLYLSVTLGR